MDATHQSLLAVTLHSQVMKMERNRAAKPAGFRLSQHNAASETPALLKPPLRIQCCL